MRARARTHTHESITTYHAKPMTKKNKQTEDEEIFDGLYFMR